MKTLILNASVYDDSDDPKAMAAPPIVTRHSTMRMDDLPSAEIVVASAMEIGRKVGAVLNKIELERIEHEMALQNSAPATTEPATEA